LGLDGLSGLQEKVFAEHGVWVASLSGSLAAIEGNTQLKSRPLKDDQAPVTVRLIWLQSMSDISTPATSARLLVNISAYPPGKSPKPTLPTLNRLT
jgi:hypothetical protein